MGSAGHAFLSHTKALSPPAAVGDGGWGAPPHPLEIRPGQRFWPRAGRRKRPFQVKRVTGDAVLAERLDGAGEQVRLTCARLLATREEDGQGRHYAFSGYVAKRYATHAALVAVEQQHAILVVPAWHPARPVRLPLRQLPDGAAPGAWFAVGADLGATSAARLSLAGFRAVADPGPERAHRPRWERDEQAAGGRGGAAKPPPASGRGCGDIVVRLPEREARTWAEPAGAATRRLVVAVQRPPEVHVTGPTPRLAAGARLYLTAGGRLLGYTTAISQRPHPNGDVFVVDAELRDAGAEPVGSVPSFQNWRWRWWPR